MKLKKHLEGAGAFFVPAESSGDPFHQPVFFNPAMEFNRSLSSRAFGASSTLLGEKLVSCDCLCALGIRGIRYSLESPDAVEKMVLVDANPSVSELVKKNISENGLSKKCSFVEIDANKFFLESDDFFDFVEIDPFGSPVFFLENAFRRLKKKSVLSVTATDLAALAGNRPKICLKHYGSKPVHNELGHEAGLRILLFKIASEAAKQDFSVRPLLCFYERHYAKCIVLLEKNALSAAGNWDSIGFGSFCPKCHSTSVSPFLSGPQKICSECKSEAEWFGPIWISKLCDDSFLKEMISPASEFGNRAVLEKEASFLNLLLCENSLPPFFLDLHSLSSSLKKKIPRNEFVIAGLKKKGFKAERTHFTSKGIKTNAPAKEVASLFK